MGLKVYTIKDPLYRQALVVLYGTHAAICRWITRRRFHDVAFGPTANGMYWVMTQDRTGNSVSFMAVTTGHTRTVERAIIRHEALHHVFHIMRHVGIPLTFDTEEAYTYHHDWVCAAITAKLHPPTRGQGKAI
jgi:hypothetical protein